MVESVQVETPRNSFAAVVVTIFLSGRFKTITGASTTLLLPSVAGSPFFHHDEHMLSNTPWRGRKTSTATEIFSTTSVQTVHADTAPMERKKLERNAG